MAKTFLFLLLVHTLFLTENTGERGESNSGCARKRHSRRDGMGPSLCCIVVLSLAAVVRTERSEDDVTFGRGQSPALSERQYQPAQSLFSNIASFFGSGGVESGSGDVGSVSGDDNLELLAHSYQLVAHCRKDWKGRLCSANGDCVQSSKAEKAFCKCKPGWIGELCDRPDVCPIGKGIQLECSGPTQGVCGEGRFGGKVCTCKPGWGHRDCSHPDCAIGVTDADKAKGLPPVMCARHGNCAKGSQGRWHCHCDKGWCGKDCSQPCECTPSCIHGECKQETEPDGKKIWKCFCDEGYQGVQCEKHGCPKCAAGNFRLECSGQGVCTVDLASGSDLGHCVCNPGWIGPCCDQPMPGCPMGCAADDEKPEHEHDECWFKCQTPAVTKEVKGHEGDESAEERTLMSNCESKYCGKHGVCCRKGMLQMGGFPFGGCTGTVGDPQQHSCAVGRAPCGFVSENITMDSKGNPTLEPVWQGTMRGVCVPNPNKPGWGMCKCKPGWTGENCCTPVTPAPTGKPSTATPSGSPTLVPTRAPTTRAPTQIPTTAVPTPPPCIPACKPHFRCDYSTVPPKCVCDPERDGECTVGYYGKSCTKCPHGCGIGGMCDQGKNGTGKCNCFSGFGGPTCRECVDGYHKCCDPDGTNCVCSQKKCPGLTCGDTTHMDDTSSNWECSGADCEYHCNSKVYGTCTNCFGGNCRCGPNLPMVDYDKTRDNSLCNECPVNHWGPDCKPCEVHCGKNGHCNDGRFGDGKCACNPGYGGDTCNECDTGYFECTTPTGKVCSGLKCDGIMCGQNSDVGVENGKLNWECVSGKCIKTCESTLINDCGTCKGGNCHCAKGELR